MALGSVAGAVMYYVSKGPSVDEAAIRKEIADIMEDLDFDDGSLGPIFVRLAWHASGTYDKKTCTGGSYGGTMRFAPEASDGANAGLDIARAKLEPIKAKFPDVSYADLYIFSGYVAIEEMGGPRIPFRWGRKDAGSPHMSSTELQVPENGRLPDAAQGSEHVRDVFYRMGFDDREIVALVGGGHAIGRCHTDRSGFEGPWTRSPTSFSNEYYRVLFEEKWTQRKWDGPNQFQDSTGDLMMLPADMVMITDPQFRRWSELYYKDLDAFTEDFSSAWKKLTELGF